MVGNRLTHLSLENLEDTDILRLGCLCPRLVSLKLSAFLTISDPLTKSEEAQSASAPFSNLEEVHLFNCREAHVPQQTVLALLRGGQVRTAYFQNLAVSWADLLVPSVVGHLTAVSFENCSELTLSCLLQLLRVDSPLGSTG